MSDHRDRPAARFFSALMLGAIVLSLGLVFEWRTGPTTVAALLAFVFGLLVFVLLPRARRGK